jgi:hypothetical protein
MLIHLQFDPSLLKEHEAPEAEEEEVDEAARKAQAAVPAE